METVTEIDELVDLAHEVQDDLECESYICVVDREQPVTHYARNAGCGCVIFLCTPCADANDHWMHVLNDQESTWVCAKCFRKSFGWYADLVEVRAL